MTILLQKRRDAILAAKRRNIRRQLAKHYGPGPHKSGTPQSVHGGGSSSSTMQGPARLQGPADLDILANRRWQEAVLKDREISPVIKRVAETSGGYTHNLHFRIKPETSVRDKIVRIQAEHAERDEPVPSAAEAAMEITDMNRFTIKWRRDDYNRGVSKAVAELEADGWQLVKAKNAWAAGDMYDGINTKWRKGDLLFELQFHTFTSAKITGKSHVLYNEARDRSTPPSKVKTLIGQIHKLWNTDRASWVPAGAHAVFGQPAVYIGKNE